MIGPRRALAVAGDSLTALPQLPALVPRVTLLLDTFEAVLARVAGLVDAIAETNLLARSVAEQAAATEAVSEVVADQAVTSSARIAELLDRFEPALTDLHPVVNETAHRLHESDAAEVVQTLQALRTVSPDLAELLEVSRTLNEMLAAVPGLGRVKKRIDDDDDA
jgi:ABC-type transporter Mla subunit MlaD